MCSIMTNIRQQAKSISVPVACAMSNQNGGHDKQNKISRCRKATIIVPDYLTHIILVNSAAMTDRMVTESRYNEAHYNKGRL